MMKALLFSLCALPFTSVGLAAVNPNAAVEALVVRDMNAILGETYNEGEGYAEAKKADCKTVKTTAKGSVVFCTIHLKVQPDTGSRYKADMTCTSMGYQVSRNQNRVENFAGWQNCVESINNTTEN